MVGILERARLVVSVDTGIMHLAAAVHAPLVALQGPTSKKRWGPLSDRAVVVRVGEKCRPCISLGFESNCDNPICMKNITVDMVLDAVDTVLKS